MVKRVSKWVFLYLLKGKTEKKKKKVLKNWKLEKSLEKTEENRKKSSGKRSQLRKQTRTRKKVIDEGQKEKKRKGVYIRSFGFKSIICSKISFLSFELKLFIK